MNKLRAERGEAFVETALVGLVVMLLVLGLLQFGLWYHAQHVVIGAAQEGAHAAALDGAFPGDGERRAVEVTGAGLGSLADGVSVSSSATERVTTMRVQASLAPLVPLFPTLTLAAEARAFKERFIPATERR
ncbi:MAG: TadE/TadG family type IV pilus assembly protein [Thermoleophilaceae bacterium]